MSDPAAEAATPAKRLGWRYRDHTRGRLLTSLAILAAPMAASSLAGVVFQMTDLVFISRLGEAPMASVVMVNQSLRQIFFLLLMGASFGTQTLIAQAVGEGRVGRAEHVAGQSIVLGAGLAIGIGLVGALFPEWLFSLPNPDPSFVPYGVPYVRLVFLLSFGVVGTLFFGAILGGAGDTTTPLLVMLLQTAVAIVAEWLLIFGNLGAPELGVEGVAIGVATGQLAAMAAGLFVLFRGSSRVHLRLRHLVPDPVVLLQIGRLSWPPALNLVSNTLVIVAMLRLTGEFGSPVQTAYALGLRLGMIAPMLCFPLAGACATLVGQALGAGKPDRAWGAVRVGLAVSCSLMSLFALALLLFRGEVVAAFSSDPEVIRYGSEYLLFASGMFFAWGFFFVFLRSLQGAGDFLVPMALSIGNSLLLTIPIAFAVARHTTLGPTGIWATQLGTTLLITVAMGLRLRSGRWARRALPSGTPPEAP